MEKILFKTSKETRMTIREGDWKHPTAGLAKGYVQANLVILPEIHAFDFLRFCFRNPKPCPLLDVTDPGNPHPDPIWGEDIDLRTDIPFYRLYDRGRVVDGLVDIKSLWKKDLVSFLLGCSFTFEESLEKENIPIRHIECGCNVPMYRTNIQCQPTGIFSGPMVVSMRPVPGNLVTKAVLITSRYPAVHGAPVYIGNPEGLGITEISKPDYGDPVPINANEVPVFWACGVTPQAVALASKIPWMITHSPGYMLITDRLNSSLAVL
jgi:uncharacterized protein YcsI (UPF0317 family)